MSANQGTSPRKMREARKAFEAADETAHVACYEAWRRRLDVMQPLQPISRQRRTAARRRRRGDCYRFAFEECVAWINAGRPDPVVRLVHGEILGLIGHAWIERGDVVYDWQRAVRFGQPPLSRTEWYSRHPPARAPVVRATYSPDEAIQALLRHRHYGPWVQP